MSTDQDARIQIEQHSPLGNHLAYIVERAEKACEDTERALATRRAELQLQANQELQAQMQSEKRINATKALQKTVEARRTRLAQPLHDACTQRRERLIPLALKAKQVDDPALRLRLLGPLRKDVILALELTQRLRLHMVKLENHYVIVAHEGEVLLAFGTIRADLV